MMSSSEIEIFNKSHNLVEMIEKINGPVVFALPFLCHAIWLKLEGNSKHAVESLMDAIDMMHMAISEPEYTKDYYNYKYKKGRLL